MKRKKVMFPDLQEIDELSGNLSKQNDEDKLMNSVLDGDKEALDEGKMLQEAMNQGIGSFVPDMMFENMVTNYKMAQQLYGETILKLVSGYDPKVLEKNIRVPELKRELQKNIAENIEKLKEKELLDEDGSVSQEGIRLASLVLYTQELDKLEGKGIVGEKESRKSFLYGDKKDVRNFKKGDRYKDISVKKSVTRAIRRKHDNIIVDDLKTFERKSKGKIEIIYAIDSSGSMKGDKIRAAKKAGVTLAYKAIEEKDKVGLISFASDVKDSLLPTDDFLQILSKITITKTGEETDIAKTIEHAITLFQDKDSTKHLILITDAMPTKGDEPEKKTLEMVGVAKEKGITISLIGIALDKKGEILAEKIVNIGEGNLYITKNLEDLDMVLLEDYYSLD